MDAAPVAHVWTSLFRWSDEGTKYATTSMLRGQRFASCQPNKSGLSAHERRTRLAKKASRHINQEHYAPIFAICIPRVFTNLPISAQFVQHFCATEGQIRSDGKLVDPVPPLSALWQHTSGSQRFFRGRNSWGRYMWSSDHLKVNIGGSRLLNNQ